MDLSDWIDRHAAFAPEKLALACAGQRCTYAQFARAIARTAAALDACGVSRGDRVAHLGYNGIEQLCLLFACARLGAIFAPLSWRLAPAEHRAMLADCRPRVLVVADPFVLPTVGIVDPAIGVRLRGDRRRARWLALVRPVPRARRNAAPSRAADVGYASPVLLCYTSGSTGQPKGVVLTQNALFHNAINGTHMHDLVSDDVVLTTLPLFHVGGLNIQTLPALHCGATVVLHPRFDPAQAIDALVNDGITLTVLVPAQLELIAREKRWQRRRPVAAARDHNGIDDHRRGVRAPGLAARRAAAADLWRHRDGADRGLPADRRRGATPGLGGKARVALRYQDRRRVWPRRGARRDRRNPGPRPERDGGLLEQAARNRRGARRRLVPHRRCRAHRCRRVSLRRRPLPRRDHLRRRKHLPGRDRERARRVRRDRGGRGRGSPGRALGRSGRRGRRAGSVDSRSPAKRCPHC